MTYKTIVVGHGPSETAREAVALAAMFARPGARVIATEVCEFDPYVPRIGVAEWQRYLLEDAQKRLEEAKERAPFQEGVELDLQVATRSSAARGLQEVAEDVGADLIVVGSSHRGKLGRMLAGGTAESLLRGAPCAVAVAPRGFGADGVPELRRIGVGYDGSPEARLALDAAVALAKEHGAELRIVTIVTPPAIPPVGTTYSIGEAELGLLEEAAKERLDEAIEHVGPGVAVDGVTRMGSPLAALEEEAEALDLLVVGSRGYGPLRRALLGSVSQALMRSVSCPMLVTPRGAREHGDDAGEGEDGS